jgi:hypothetical protein
MCSRTWFREELRRFAQRAFARAEITFEARDPPPARGAQSTFAGQRRPSFVVVLVLTAECTASFC